MKSFSLEHWEHFKKIFHAVEQDVSLQEGSYKGLSLDALYTSFEDLIHIFQNPLIKGTFVDLGCGIGITALIYASMFPDRKSFGVEFEQARVVEGEKIKNELGLTSVTLLHQNLLTSSLPIGDTYFLYFPTGMVLDRILNELYQGKNDFILIVIESHGDLFSRLDKENWLKIVDEIPLLGPRHNPRARIYKRLNIPRDSSLFLHDLSFIERILEIGSDETWLGETLGLEWLKDDIFELKVPPRSIVQRDVKKVSNIEDFGPRIQFALRLRRKGVLIFELRGRRIEGHIRKIVIRPTFGLEISTGEKLEWDEITAICQGNILCYASC